MKLMSFVIAALFALSAKANETGELSVELKLSSEESYKLYDFLDVQAVEDPDGRVLVKRAENVVCSRSSFYPGDLEYSCTLSVQVSKAGQVVR